MRDDLNKLLCERERHGHRNRFKPYRRTKAFSPAADEDGDNRPQREGISRRYGYSRKSFNENLNPLKGQVRKAVGRPYGKFYSELCKIFDKRSVINQHILQHLKDYLSTDVYIGNDGQLWARVSPWPDAPLREAWRIEFYVDPRDGIIKKNKWHTSRRQHYARRPSKAEELSIEVDAYTQLRRVDGSWYEVSLQRADPLAPGTDIFTRDLVVAGKYAARKRAAATVMLRNFGLI